MAIFDVLVVVRMHMCMVMLTNGGGTCVQQWWQFVVLLSSWVA